MQGLTARPSFYRHALLSAPTRVLQLSTNWRGSCQGVHLQKIAQTIEFPQNAQVELLTADTPFCPLTAMPDTVLTTMMTRRRCGRGEHWPAVTSAAASSQSSVLEYSHSSHIRDPHKNERCRNNITLKMYNLTFQHKNQMQYPERLKFKNKTFANLYPLFSVRWYS